jgi:hypothetical protein
MKALCKQSYPYGDGGGGLGLTIDSKHQNFLSGKTYDIIDSIHHLIFHFTLLQWLK